MFSRAGDDSGDIRGTVGPLALALLEAVDEGRPAGDLCRALALAVLASETPGEAPWTAAVEVIEGGPLRIRRAVALAGMILDREEPSSRRSLHT